VDKKPEKEPAAPPVEEAPAEPRKKLPLPKILIVAGVIVVQVVASYFLQKTFIFTDVTAAKAASVAAEKAEKEKKKTPEVEPTVVMLDEIVVNPAETGGRRYLAVTVGLQMNVPEADKLVEKNKPVIRDALISLLAAKHLDQLANVAYRDSLKLEIKDAINKQLKNNPIDNVVFSGYVLQ
jgi:flagellar protein FliL